MKYARIIGTGSYLPEKIITNVELEKTLDTTDEWIRERTGIIERRIVAKDETTSSIATKASLNALDAAGYQPSQVDMILLATTTPDLAFPSAACLVQKNLQLTDCPAFDLNAACSGFNYALSVADQYIRTGYVKTILVIGSETLSRIMDWDDRSTCVLFGDGAGAVLLTADDKPGILSTHLHADSRYSDLLFSGNQISIDPKAANAKVKMSGRDVFKLAVSYLGDIVEETLSANHMSVDDIDWLIPHQANLRIIQATAKKLKLPMEKIIITLDKQGNTSSASIPLALDTAIRNHQIKRGDVILLESFGGGITWGSALIKY